MITIRKYEPSDSAQIEELSKIHSLRIPAEGFCLVAVDENNVVEGFTIIRYVPMIEPFVCTNPLIAKKLYDGILAMVPKSIYGNSVVPVRCNIQEHDRELLEKLGFEQIFEGQIQMEKINK
jgi:hypothetical protein